MARKSWAEKRDGAHAPHVSILPKPFMGAPAGAILFVPSPSVVQAYIEAIPAGETRSVAEMRQDLARVHNADVTCPTSTGIFVRIVAEAALEDIHSGTPLEAVPPFWRLIAPDSEAASKLSCGPAFIGRLREAEAQQI
jgi:hypothetical protein